MKTSKKLLSILLALLMLLSFGTLAFAEDDVTVVERGPCGAPGDDVNYTLYSDGKLVIDGRGAIKEHAFNSGAIVLSEAMYTGKKDLIIKDGITAIGASAFAFLPINSIDFGNTLETIGVCAFYDSDGFEEIVLPESLRIVEDCAFGLSSYLKKVTFGHNVESIGDWTFLQCRDLETIVFLNGNTQIIQLEHPAPIWEGAYHEELNTIHCGTVYSYSGGSVEAHCRTYSRRFVPLDADGHVWDDGAVTTQPTCTEDGERTYNCILCDATKTEPVPATDHNWSNWETVRDATIFKKGEEKRFCLNDPTHTETRETDRKPSPFKWLFDLFDQWFGR